ncbi:histidine phosphotransferase family protein [Aurantimonas sp. Leaf443]|uniref:histidine phosphotransferase family protein n=1 Tax=Aurantimonas sp. Leaf443 TaxID=1736378 RepID=UPI0009E9107E|nr:histidine phosphotransferase family protein [Aurantimonas sp. Leaf443]
MTKLPDLSSADLAALLASRLCHDIISPVFGIQSGLELLDDMPDDKEAHGLMRSSLKCAVARLQMARIAFGAAGAQTSNFDLNEAKQAASGYMEHEKASLVWEGQHGYVPKNIAKIVLNLVVLASTAISRGGEVRVSVEQLEPPLIRVKATGERIRVHSRFIALLEGTSVEQIDAQAIQPYYTLFLADQAGLQVTMQPGEGSVTFLVAPKAAAEPVAAAGAVSSNLSPVSER